MVREHMAQLWSRSAELAHYRIRWFFWPILEGASPFERGKDQPQFRFLNENLNNERPVRAWILNRAAWIGPRDPPRYRNRRPEV